MKKNVLKIAVACCFSLVLFACQPDVIEELNIEILDQTSDPDEPQPGCDDIEGCDSSITKG